MDKSPLTQAHVVPFLTSDNEELQKTGAWVAAHHPDWGEAVKEFLADYLEKFPSSNRSMEIAKELFVTFGKDPGIQQLLASRLRDPSTPVETKLLLLDALDEGLDKASPANTQHLLVVLLRQPDPVIQSRVIEIIHSRGMATLNGDLAQVISSRAELPAFRMKALGARLMSNAKLASTEFNMLLDFLGSDQDVNIRQTAARLLTQAQLDNSQLLILAERYIPSTDIFLLPVLLENFEDSDNEAVGTALVNALTSTNQLDNVSPTRLEKILQRFPNAVRTSARPLMERIRQQQSSRLAVLEEMWVRVEDFSSEKLCAQHVMQWPVTVESSVRI
jgi:hypothetical protein